MKLFRYANSHGESFAVQTDDGQILDPHALSTVNELPAAMTLDELISNGKRAVEAIKCSISKSSVKQREKAAIETGKMRFLAPVAFPPKIICLGLNYRDHAAEQDKPPSEEPVIFMKPHTAVIGPEDSIVKPEFVRELDYEAELAVIICERGKDIKVENAKNHIFGYTCFNDVSARDIQFKDKQWTRGKSFDTFAPMGPCITTSDQIGDPTSLRIRTMVNGELRQDSSTRNMVFNVYQIVHELSRVMTLEPCDVIATGTPAGVAFAMKPRPKFLSPGDVVEVEIENIGVLRNRVVASPNCDDCT